MAELLAAPDVEAWAVAYLKAALTGRPEAYAREVRVSTKLPNPRPARAVTVRDDGGPNLDRFRSTHLLGVSVWAPETEVGKLAGLVRALLLASADGDPVVYVVGQSGPLAIPDDPEPHRYLVVELTVRTGAL